MPMSKEDLVQYRGVLQQVSMILRYRRLPGANKQRAAELVLEAATKLLEVCEAMQKRLADLDTTSTDREMVP